MEIMKVQAFLETQKVPKDQIQELSQMILKTNSVILNAFEAFITNGTEPDLCIENYTCKGLMQEFGLSLTGALLTLDWLLREPEEAKQAIKDGIK